MKVKLAERGITLKSYVLGLIEKDLHTPLTVQADIDAIRTAAEKVQEGANELIALTER